MNRTIDNLNNVASYLARRDTDKLTADKLGGPVDTLVVLGSSLLEPVELAAAVFRQGLAKRLLISGGVGHSTQDLHDAVAAHPDYCAIATEGRAEADIVYDILRNYLKVSPETMLVENQSTTCGGNAELSRRLLGSLGLAAGRILLIQDPTMQRRSHACFERQWRDMPKTKIISYAPFVPKVEQNGADLVVKGSTQKVWPFERFVSLVLGEIPRLRDDKNGYGPKGRNFIDHVEVPEDILDAHAMLAAEFPQLVRE